MLLLNVTRIKTILILISVLLLLLGGCAINAEEKNKHVEKEQATVSGIPFSGKVIWVELEGGFWGIMTHQGQKLDPRGLPESMRKEGLRVKGTIRLLKNMMSIRMWGTLVEITAIEEDI